MGLERAPRMVFGYDFRGFGELPEELFAKENLKLWQLNALEF